MKIALYDLKAGIHLLFLKIENDIIIIDKST